MISGCRPPADASLNASRTEIQAQRVTSARSARSVELLNASRRADAAMYGVTIPRLGLSVLLLSAQ